jgi:hypothetical protein
MLKLTSAAGPYVQTKKIVTNEIVQISALIYLFFKKSCHSEQVILHVACKWHPNRKQQQEFGVFTQGGPHVER